VLEFNGTTACIEVNWFTPAKVRTLVATGSEGILDYYGKIGKPPLKIKVPTMPLTTQLRLTQ
jgi:hypothetical protein